MDFSIEVIKIVFFLIPGILSMLIIERLTTHKKIEFDRFSIYSTVLSFFTYISHYYIWKLFYELYISFKWVDPIIAKPQIILYDFLKNQDIENTINVSNFIWIFLVTLILSLFLSFIINNKLINRLGQFIKVTTKYGDESVWDYFHNKPDNVWVVVRDLKNDLMYFGWIEVFSDDGSEFDELVLQNVTVYKNSTGEKMYETGEIYLAGKREDFRIEIYNYKG